MLWTAKAGSLGIKGRRSYEEGITMCGKQCEASISVKAKEFVSEIKATMMSLSNSQH